MRRPRRPTAAVSRSGLAAARLARAEAHWLAGQTLTLALAEADLARTAAVAGSPPMGPRPPGTVLAAPLRGLARKRPAWSPSRFRRARRLPGKAAQLWRDLGCRYQAALALFDADDQRLLRQALELFTELRATAAVGLARLKMRRYGHQVDPGRPEVRHPG